MLLGLLFLFSGFFAQRLEAGTHIFENALTQPVCELYLSPAGRDLWGPDLLGGLCLAPGERRGLNIERGPDWDQEAPGFRGDLAAVPEDGLPITYMALDLAVFFFVVFQADRADLYEFVPTGAEEGSEP